jgi:hypothetical protein
MEATKMSEQIRTIKELLHAYYGGGDVVKTDAPVVTTTTGVFNAVYGAQAFSQLNNESNVFGLLPKYPWQKSGWRVITADGGSAGDGGLAEAGTIPDAIKPTFLEIDTKPKQVVHTFMSSFIHDGLVKKGDDAIGDMEFLRGYFATLHAKRIDQQLCKDADTLAGNSMESIDRVTISSTALAALSYTAGDEDMYGIDRSAASWSQPVCLHNSGTDRVLSDLLLRTLITNVREKGGKPTIMITGYDTVGRIQGLYENQVRYPGVLNRDVRMQVGINGVQTAEGNDVGLRVAAVYGVPLFEAQHVEKDTISRVYLLDTTLNPETGIPRLGISLLYPTLYAESGMSAADKNPFSINATATKGMYYTAGELICTFFAGQGSLRDLK